MSRLDWESEIRPVLLAAYRALDTAGGQRLPQRHERVELLETRIMETTDETERTRLEQFRDAVVSIGTGVVTGVLTDLARRSV